MRTTPPFFPSFTGISRTAREMVVPETGMDALRREALESRQKVDEAIALLGELGRRLRDALAAAEAARGGGSVFPPGVL